MKARLKPEPRFSWEQLGALRKEAGLAEDAPANSFTADEYAAKFVLGRWTANQELQRLVAAGTLNVGRKAVISHGRRFLKKAYWPARGGKHAKPASMVGME
jgi:hypothetical protein